MRKMMKFQPKVCEVTYDPTGIREQRKKEAEIVPEQSSFEKQFDKYRCFLIPKLSEFPSQKGLAIAFYVRIRKKVLQNFRKFISQERHLSI